MNNIEIIKKHAAEYDLWFEENEAVYKSEILALHDLISVMGIGLDVGVGTGRFADPLGIRIDLEPPLGQDYERKSPADAGGDDYGLCSALNHQGSPGDRPFSRASSTGDEAHDINRAGLCKGQFSSFCNLKIHGFGAHVLGLLTSYYADFSHFIHLYLRTDRYMPLRMPLSIRVHFTKIPAPVFFSLKRRKMPQGSSRFS
jgi:hypothetical protein